MDQAAFTSLLDHLIAQWEDEVVEFKRGKDSYSASDLGKYLSALANEANLRGKDRAWIVFGVDNKTRQVVGTTYKESSEHLQATKKQVLDGTSSITFRDIHELLHPDGRVILFEVPAAPRGMPITWSGHAYGRAGETGIQSDKVTDEQLGDGTGFTVTRNETVQAASARSAVKYDLLGKVSDATDLLRQTVAQILTGIEPAIFDQYRANPEHFISEAARLIKEQKAGHLIEQLVYDPIDERYDADIFTAAEIGQDFSRATERLKNHVFDYCITDSGVERDFVGELDTSAEVEVYAKLPRGFLIPTPVGDYNPDWAIVFRAGAVKHIYFVAETKGSMSSLALRDLERAKIDCAKKFFAKLAESNPTPNVRYGVADSYNKLMEIVTT